MSRTALATVDTTCVSDLAEVDQHHLIINSIGLAREIHDLVGGDFGDCVLAAMSIRRRQPVDRDWEYLRVPRRRRASGP